MFPSREEKKQVFPEEVGRIAPPKKENLKQVYSLPTLMDSSSLSLFFFFSLHHLHVVSAQIGAVVLAEGSRSAQMCVGCALLML